MAMKRTALYDEHKKMGGKLIDFFGWELPVQYEGIIEEHESVRNNAGIFDVSHMGEVVVIGKESLAFVNYLVTNDVSKLSDGQVLYTMMCNEKGGVVDDLLVYKMNDQTFFLVINAGNIEKDLAWMNENSKQFDVHITDESDQYAQIAIQGPNAQNILQKIVDFNLDDLPFFCFKNNCVIEGGHCLISRTGYTGEDGFELYLGNKAVVKVWNKLLEVGQEVGLKPAGLGARDTLRFEAQLPLYGNEIDEDISPLEAGLKMFVKLDKKNFIGKEALVNQKSTRKIVGFEIKKGIPRHGYDVIKNDSIIGKVTTGYFSPTLKKNIGLALINSEYGEIGETFDIQIRNKKVPAQIISKRFYHKQYKK